METSKLLRLAPWWNSLRRTRAFQLMLLVYCAIIAGLSLFLLRGRGADDAAARVQINVGQQKLLGGSQVHDHDGFRFNNTLYGQGTERAVHEQWNFGSPCAGFPGTDDILVVMKTGATEAYQKLPTQLITSLQCLPDLLIFSDMEQQMGKYHLYNALDGISSTVRQANPEFRLYEAQLSCPLSPKECTTGTTDAWNLDKYKFLHMLVRVWEMRPGRRWYVFVEADTYVFWPNLVQWLRTRIDGAGDDDLYIGNVAMLEDFPFAHGGSGYVMTGRLVQRVVETVPDVAAKYDELGPQNCCGDVMLALAIDEVGTRVRQASPMFNNERPSTLPFGHGMWCEPVLTLHHMSPDEVGLAWQYEQTRTKKGPVQLRDVYEALVAPKLAARRRDWDNLSDGTCYIGPDAASQQAADSRARGMQMEQAAKSAVEKQAHESDEACAAVCEAEGLAVPDGEWANAGSDAERAALLAGLYDGRLEAADAADFKRSRRCFQWRFHRGVCCTGTSFRLGRPQAAALGDAVDDTPTSGWFVRGINDWIEAQGDCDVEWRELPPGWGQESEEAREGGGERVREQESEEARE